MDLGASGRVYRFSGYTFDLARGRLFTADEAELTLRPKSFALLRHMVENAGRLVSRDELMQAVWPGVLVTDGSIAQCVKEIRRALGDSEQQLLRTLPRRGYLLAASVSRANAGSVTPSAPNTPVPDAVHAPPSGRPLLVVLPLIDLGGDPGMAYFTSGLTAIWRRISHAFRTSKWSPRPTALRPRRRLRGWIRYGPARSVSAAACDRRRGASA